MKPMRQVEPLETIWEIPDDLWEKVEPVILEGTPPKITGRKRVNPRPILNGIIFRLRKCRGLLVRYTNLELNLKLILYFHQKCGGESSETNEAS